MYTLIVENEKGEQLELTHNQNYDVLEIVGTNPPLATINTTSIVGFDGAKFNSSRIEQRNLVISLNIRAPIEENRQRLYKYFRLKRYCKIYFKNQNRDVYVEGYVESFENNQFQNLQKPQISIICPDPFFKEINEILVEFSNRVALFEFPFSIPTEGIEFSQIEHLTTRVIDVGDIEGGGIITIAAETDRILNPTIYNRTTGVYFGLDFDMQAGDVIIINTNRGEKSVTLLREGVTTNILSSRRTGSTWIQFLPGENEISYDSDEGSENIRVNVSVTKKYEGV